MGTKSLRKFAFCMVFLLLFGIFPTVRANTDVASLSGRAFYGVNTEKGVVYTGKTEGGVRTDFFAVAIEINTGGKALAGLGFTLTWNPELLTLVGADLDKIDMHSRYLSEKDENNQSRVMPNFPLLLNIENKTGTFKWDKYELANWKSTNGTTFTTGGVLLLYFVPRDGQPASAEITISECSAYYMKSKNLPEYYPLQSQSFTVPLNKHAEELPLQAIESLGAQINMANNGLRFGARYFRVPDKTVVELGMLLYPTAKLAGEALTVTYYADNPYHKDHNPAGVLKVPASRISQTDYVVGKTFEDYESFEFCISIMDIPSGSLGVEITAVPYVGYSDGTYEYGAPKSRSFDGVLNNLP